MELIDRYVYAVIKHIPSSQREDMTKELNSLIYDMFDERSESLGQENAVRSVLEELGDPQQLAEKYRDRKRYLIGPALFEKYITFLKIVLFAVLIAVTVGFVIEFLIEPDQLLNHFINYLISLISTAFSAFSSVTIIFMTVEYFGIKTTHLNIHKNGQWRVDDLSSQPDQEKQIRRVEPIMGIIFSIIGLILFIFFNNYIGAFIHINGDLTIVPLLNKTVISSYLPLIIIGFGLVMVKECLKFIIGEWTMGLVGIVAIINLLSLFVLFIILRDHTLWNPEFVEGLVESGTIQSSSKGYTTATFIWKRATLITLGIMSFIFVFDIINGFLKARK